MSKIKIAWYVTVAVTFLAVILFGLTYEVWI